MMAKFNQIICHYLQEQHCWFLLRCGPILKLESWLGYSLQLLQLLYAYWEKKAKETSVPSANSAQC